MTESLRTEVGSSEWNPMQKCVKRKSKINGGLFQGKYLADVLEADLMEMPDTLQQAA